MEQMEESKCIQMAMNMAAKTDGLVHEGLPPSVQQQQQKQEDQSKPVSAAGQQQQLPQKTKRKHRRGKPKAKNSNKPYKKFNYFQMPRLYHNNNNNKSGGGAARAKLVRSRSLVPYNTNKFLMEEHLADVPSALLTPRGRTRDSSFSVDSEDNYFYSLPEDEEEFLTKEFANVYEKARVERLDNLTKQQLIEECLQMEDRYSSDQLGTQRQQQMNVQRISAEYAAKIRALEEKMRELARENYNLRCQLMRSAAGLAAAAAASPPSAAAPTGSACTPSTPMVATTSEDSESDSSSTSSSSSSSSSSRSRSTDGGGAAAAAAPRRRRSCSSARSSLSEYNAYIENNYIMGNADGGVNGIDEEEHVVGAVNINALDYERQQLLEPTAVLSSSAAAHMDEDSNTSPEVEQLATAAPVVPVDDLAKSSHLLPTSRPPE